MEVNRRSRAGGNLDRAEGQDNHQSPLTLSLSKDSPRRREPRQAESPGFCASAVCVIIRLSATGRAVLLRCRRSNQIRSEFR